VISKLIEFCAQLSWDTRASGCWDLACRESQFADLILTAEKTACLVMRKKDSFCLRSQAAQAAEINCRGPFAADLFSREGFRGEFDLVVAMYHDQGHIPMKLVDFENTVNVSLGLPIIRTSVDHGTAFDIASQNRADATNMKAAMRLAVEMTQRNIAGRCRVLNPPVSRNVRLTPRRS
jgi:hypothetical protein